MYSARFINESATPLSTLAGELPATEAVLPGWGGILVNRSGDFELSGREAWIFISIKNRAFNRPYINRFIQLCEKEKLAGHICPVDDPYRYNRMAELGIDDLPAEEADKIERLSGDIARMAQKAVNGSRTKRVDLVKWRDLEEATPPIYRRELTRAFKEGGPIRRALYEHVSSVKQFESERDFERYAEFFLCEVPVLLYTYYSRGPTMDIYPGPQPRFFWEIELGIFEDQLPELTALTRRSRSLLYLDTHHRKRLK